MSASPDDNELTEDDLSALPRFQPAPRIFAVLDAVWWVYFAGAAAWFHISYVRSVDRYTSRLAPTLVVISLAWPLLVTVIQYQFVKRKKLKLVKYLPLLRWFSCAFGTMYLKGEWLGPIRDSPDRFRF